MPLTNLVEIPRSLFILLQAFGWAVIFYIIFQVVNYKMNKKRNQEFKRMNKNLEDIKRLLREKKKKR